MPKAYAEDHARVSRLEKNTQDQGRSGGGAKELKGPTRQNKGNGGGITEPTKGHRGV